MRGIKGFTVIDLLAVISLIALLMVVLLPALQRVHASYSADAGAGAFFEATEKSGPAEECWLVLYDPNCDHQVVVFKTQVPGPGAG